MLVFGSGGHTTEMLMFFKDFNFTQFEQIYFVKAESDHTSQNKIRAFIEQNQMQIMLDKVIWINIPRSREVKQNIFSSVFTTLYSIIVTYLKLSKLQIDVMVCNGPGTCIPIAFSLLLNKILMIYNTKIIFLESFCRVEYLSLTGKLLYPFADKFIVQWPELAQKLKYASYYGNII